MRNLKLVQSTALKLDSDLPLSAHTWDRASDAIICAFGPTLEKPVIELRRTIGSRNASNSNTELITSWDAPCPLPDLGVDRVLDVHHFADSDTICVVLEGGDIVLVRNQLLPGQEKIEIVGSVDVGITAAAWSPNGALLAVTTRADTLLFMTAEFDNVADITFLPEDAQLSKHVSVGWGKVETQFKGKRAKALRDPTMPETVDEGTLSLFDQGQVSISWRGDGAYVAINSIENGSRRMIRIFTREGILDSVSEPVNGLEGTLSWRPAGNLIAGVQRLDDLVNVVFFERNGLRHGQFELRLSATDQQTWASAIGLQWNLDSTILAVAYADRVQLWTMGNYHYYLKHTLRNNGDGFSAASSVVHWHSDQALRLSWQSLESPGAGEEITDIEGHQTVSTNEYIFAIDSGPCEAPEDFGLIAVIDGKTLKITPLRIANVPPPMAFHEITLDEEIQTVAINSTNDRIAILHGRGVSMFQSSIPAAKSKISMEFTIDSDVEIAVPEGCRPDQICFLGASEFYILIKNLSTGRSSLLISSNDILELPEAIAATVLRIFPSVDCTGLCVTTTSGIFELAMHPYSVGGGICETRLISTTLAHTPWAEVVSVDDEVIAFGLSHSGDLFSNDRLLLRNCTSFLLTTSHLIITTTNHLLKFVHLTQVRDLDVPPDEPEKDERCRSIERGAKLVTVMPSVFSIVLQMPRGNLETIYPRALVLAGIRRNIEQKHYREAFLACRSQRVDTNILHDHAPQQLLDNVKLFVDQVRKVEYIDLFLSQLRDEDVSKTMYIETIARRNAETLMATEDYEANSGPVTGKVNRICHAFLHVLETRYSSNLRNVITAQVCQIPPNIEAALGVIKNLREKQSDMADTAVEHICFLVDVNQVYETALGMYDIDLTLLVAQQSQKDPREYLPYLQTLQELPELRRQFKIDDDLGQHGKALRHLYALQVVGEVRQYTQRHELYKAALELYRYESEHRSQILRDYADYLKGKSRFKEAAVAYDALSDYDSATAAYRSASMWRECLSAALSIPLSENDLSTLAQSLADTLVESKDFADAATIYLEYLKDLEGGIRYLCKAYQFTEASSIVKLRGRTELMENLIEPGLVEASASLTETLADCKAQLGAQVPRLKELRAIKASDPLRFLEGAGDSSGIDIPDNLSIAASTTASTTNASLYTRYTGGVSSTAHTGVTRKTSKNKRREERKRARGKKGSVYEEEYLVNSVGRLIDRVNSIQGDVERTVRGCLGRDMWERARAVEDGMVEVVALCEAALSEVWVSQSKPQGMADGAIEGEDALEGRAVRPRGAEGVLWDSMEAGRVGAPAPVVKVFERVGLFV